MFLITGAPRSGTTYTMNMLERAGLKLGGEGDIPRDGLDGIVSWKHLPVAREHKYDFVALQLRNPMRTIMSMQTITLASWNLLIDRIVRHHEIDFEDGNPIKRGAWVWYWWIRWAKAEADFYYRVEDDNQVKSTLSSRIGRRSILTVGRSVRLNSRRGQYRRFSYSDMHRLGGVMMDRVVETASQFGYTRDDLQEACHAQD